MCMSYCGVEGLGATEYLELGFEKLFIVGQ